MWVSENLLFLLVRFLYKSEVCHSSEMKQSLSNIDKYDQFRSSRADIILKHAQKFGVDINDKILLDFGCGDGAITPHYLAAGAREVVGIDIDPKEVKRAEEQYSSDKVRFQISGPKGIPLEDNSIDVVISYDVFEHITDVPSVLSELYRIVRPKGKVLLGTWGWYHPFAPHLFSTMPVPWAHVFFSEKTILRTCRRVFNSPWYVPTMHDRDEQGKKRTDKYLEEEIPLNYVNKLFIQDFQRIFASSDFRFEMFPVPFGSKYAKWTKVFLRSSLLREFLTGYLWIVLYKDGPSEEQYGREKRRIQYNREQSPDSRLNYFHQSSSC